MPGIAAFLAFAAVGLAAMGIAVRAYTRRAWPVPGMAAEMGMDTRPPGVLVALAAMGSSLFGPARIESLERSLVRGGRPHGWTGGQVAALQIGGVVAGLFLLTPLCYAALGPGGILVGALGGLMGYMLPQAVVDRSVEARQRLLARDLPAAIDLIAVGVEAGMPLAAAMRQVALRMPDPLREEMLRTVQDMEANTWEVALAGMAERTGLADMARLAWILQQGARYGIPVAETLRQYSGDLRRSRSMDLQARAAALPILMLGPMLIFGLLPILAIVLGPVAIQMAGMFRM